MMVRVRGIIPKLRQVSAIFSPARIHVHLTHLSSIKTLRALGNRVLPDVSGWCELLHTWPLYLRIISMSSLQEEPWWKAFLRKYQKHIQLFLILLGVLAAWPAHWVPGVVVECCWFNAPGFPIHNFGNLQGKCVFVLWGVLMSKFGLSNRKTILQNPSFGGSTFNLHVGEGCLRWGWLFWSGSCVFLFLNYPAENWARCTFGV
jgi:hypothetical protein